MCSGITGSGGSAVRNVAAPGGGGGVLARPAASGGRSGDAFTLVELLVVVAIIALLVGLILPSLSRAKALTRLGLCQTRLRAQAQAHAIYSSDHDDKKPPMGCTSGWWTFYDWMSPNTKVLGYPVGQGILVKWDYVGFEALLCPAAWMSEDTALDREMWNRRKLSGSSFDYFWRRPPANPGGFAELSELDVTYLDMTNSGHPALAMDINADEGHAYSGAYEPGQRLASHPVVGRLNVAYIGAYVRCYDNEEVVLRPPGRVEQKLAWWDQAHGRR